MRKRTDLYYCLSEWSIIFIAETEPDSRLEVTAMAVLHKLLALGLLAAFAHGECNPSGNGCLGVCIGWVEDNWRGWATLLERYCDTCRCIYIDRTIKAELC